FTSPASTQIYGQTQVNPLAGSAGLVFTLTLIIVSYEPIRRKFYSNFYMHHRIFSLLAILTIMIHSTVVRYAMIVPLISYGLSGVLRLRAFCQRYDATAEIGEGSIVILTLPSTKRTSQWAQGMNPSSYFYIQVPSISVVEWHPFSAVVTPMSDTITFYLKTMGKGKFVDSLYNVVKTRTNHGRATIPVLIGGPYGKLSVDILQYQVVILVAGGIGITPMLSLVNQFRNKQGKAGGVFHLYWTVREVNSLLMVDKQMYPLPQSLVHKFYVTAASTEGQITTSSGLQQHYYAKRPVWDELINPVAFVGKSVCVLTCGPGQLTRDIQRVARQCGYDFHKEEFEF
ncbi:transmembrane protein, partial [Thraustotheca clavata]